MTVEVCVFVTVYQQEQSLLQHLAAVSSAALSTLGWARHYFSDCMWTASKRKPERQKRAESEGHHSYVIYGPSHENGMVDYLGWVLLKAD